MFKRFFLVIFSSTLIVNLFFSFPVFASTELIKTLVQPTISPAPSSIGLLISYKKGQSPNDLDNELKKAKADESTVGGFLNKQFLKLFNKKTQSEILQEKISYRKSVEKKINVISSNKMSSISNISPAVYVIQLKPGTDSKTAITELKKLPEVESVIPNFVIKAQARNGSSIQSTETVPSTVQFIVLYKKDQAPNQIQTQVDNRLGMVGQIAKIVDVITKSETPEDKMNKIKSTWEKLDYVYSKDAFTTPTHGNELLENTQVITFKNTKDTSTIIKEYKKLPEVQAIIPNFAVKATNTPNDPRFTDLWGLKKIQTETAWDTSQGSNSVKVAVLDSGMDYNHEDLSANYAGGYDFSTCNDTVPANSCFNPKARDADPMDDEGHGTHVSGTIGAVGNNNVGVVGVNWNVKLLAVKVLGSGGVGLTNDILDGINYAVENGAKVINMSLGSSIAPYTCADSHPDLVIIRNVLNNAKNAGVTIVVTAGNDNADAGYDLFSSCPGVIAVGASGPSDERASYSNYGSVVTIAAPGGVDPIASTCDGATAQMILSTYPNNRYACMNGTSMAAPHVAGAAALLLSINPNLTPDQIKDLLVQNADAISTDQPIGPRLNLAKAVAAVSGGITPTITIDPTPTLPPDVTPTPTLPPDVTPTVTIEPTPTTAQISPTPTTPPGNISVSVKLPGIGTDATGDNTNPQPSQRQITAEFINSDGVSLANATVTVTFQENNYTGTISQQGLPVGAYQIKIRLDNTLNKLVPGFYTLGDENSPVTLPTVTLTSGDINQDGVLDILDYNILLSCIQVGCSGNSKTLSDLNSNGAPNAADLNIFFRQLSQRIGD